MSTLIGICLLLFSLSQAQNRCQRGNIAPCPIVRPRDVVFLVDASDSMDPIIFYGQMLDYVQDLWCAINVDTGSRGAMITFGRTVETRIPLADWTQDEWYSQVELVRATPDVCCHCCTPTAEAFDAATNIFTLNSPSVGAQSIVFTITDGDPWQNTRGPGYLWPRIPAAKYRYNVVPQSAWRLKNYNGEQNPTKARLMIVGVPNKWGDEPNLAYFQGVPNPALGKGNKQCIRRNGRRNCAYIGGPLYPIVTTPLDKNAFVADNWNVTELIALTGTNLCEELPTFPPSPPPTRAPASSAPTKKPTASPVSRAPTQNPTVTPTRSPSTAAPSHTPTLSPTEKRVFDQLDLILYLDRSRSMRWRASSCRQAVGSDPNADDNTVCWKLFLRFVKRIVYKSTELSYEENRTQRKIGWFDDDPSKPSRGLRVWVYGFACANQQSTPIVERIAERIGNLADFNAAMQAAESIIPDGGTCPGAAIQRSIGFIMASQLLDRPYKAALLFTDGVFYDQPIPEQVVKGLHYFGVLTYALGISIPDNGNNFGLKPFEIEDQRRQLLAFAEGREDRRFNFGLEGLNLLESIADDFITKLPLDIENFYPKLLDRPFWCGFTNNERCLNTNEETFNTARFCKWIPNDPDNFGGNGRCFPKDDCSYVKSVAECRRDRFCERINGRCVYAGPPLTP